MNKKRLSCVTVSLFFASALLHLACGQPKPIEPYRPNIVLVSIDTLRADHLSSYGYHRLTSPFLDSFAREAALFENAYAQASHTLPSHMSMMTSLFPKAHGVDRESGPLGDGISTLAEILKSADYTTAGIYAIPWLDSKFGFSRGFDSYKPRGGGPEGGARSREAALELLEEFATYRDRPFFLFLHLRDVHCGPELDNPQKPLYNSPPEFRDTFLPFPDLTITHLPIDIWLSKVRLTDEEHANIIAQYDGGILYADSVLRDIFEYMETLNLYTETLIIVTSDHGESLGEHNDFSLHGSLWEEGLRVPLIVKLPDSHPDREIWRDVRLKHRVQSVDITPTILNILEIPLPGEFQGRDLFDSADRDVIAHFNRHSVLIRGNYKVKVARIKNNYEIRLFDLAADPEEMTGIQKERVDLMKSMARSLEAYHKEHQELFNKISESEDTKVDLDSEQKEALKALGYLD